SRIDPREAKRREQPECDRLAVAHVEPTGRLQRVGEGVSEVEDRPLAALVWVAQADAGLVEGAPPDELGVRKLPERLAGEPPGRDPLGQACATLALRQRREQRRVAERRLGPVEGADEVLALR